MYAIRQHEFGPPDTLVYESVPDPEPAAGQLGIAVRAAGVHLVDTVLRSGRYQGKFPAPVLPMIPGREVAGTVDAVGPGVDPGWVGRRVVAHLGWASGGYAERAVAAAASVHELPDGVDPAAAVAMIGSGRTALAILDLAAVTSQDVVLVPSAAGGLGNLFVQAVRHAGGFVIGLAGGPEKVAVVDKIGADAAIDYREPDWPDRVNTALGGRELSLVLDGVGGAVGRQSLELLGIGGRQVIFGWSAGEPTRLETQDLQDRGLTVTALGPRLLRRPELLRELETRAMAELAAGRLVPVVDSQFPLAQAARAHAALESRATVGKTVLLPGR
jgi:NADPH2:quinone reductase